MSTDAPSEAAQPSVTVDYLVQVGERQPPVRIELSGGPGTIQVADDVLDALDGAVAIEGTERAETVPAEDVPDEMSLR